MSDPELPPPAWWGEETIEEALCRDGIHEAEGGCCDAMPRTVTLAFEDLQMLFDIAVGSMDFGSGFLDDEEVTVLRRVAKDKLGVDPMVGTPRNYASRYPHPFKEGWGNHCKTCYEPADIEAHQEAA